MKQRNLVIQLAASDNVGVATCPLRAGDVAVCNQRTLTVHEDIPIGHKIAIEPIPAAAKVIKFGAPIGSATCDICTGEHVHLHNLKSDYLPTYTFDAGTAYVRLV